MNQPLPIPETALQTPQEMITSFLEVVKTDIIDAGVSKDMVATGKTLASLEVKPLGETGGELVGNENIIFMETGRGPTKPGTPPSNPTLVEALAEWMEARGMTGSPYALAKTIHKEGTRLYRMGGNSGVLSIPLREERIADLFGKISENLMYRTASAIFESVNTITSK